MTATLETPSRIWRRIEAIENRDMPSLPSLPPFDDSGDIRTESSDMLSNSDEELDDIATAVHSTPASTFRAASTGTLSTARFARSIASRSTKSSTGPSAVVSSAASVSQRKLSVDSFDVSKIPSIPRIHAEVGHHSNGAEDSHHDIYLPAPEDDDLSMSGGLPSISQSGSPAYGHGNEKTPKTPKKSYDYSVSLKSEPEPSPIDRFRNVALRRPPSRTRTPSLTHTLTSTSSSPTNDTPPSVHALAASRSNTTSPVPGASIPLPPSRTSSESPAVAIHRAREDVSPTDEEQRSMSQSMQAQSMDITDVQISPPQLGHASEGQYATTVTEDEQDISEETNENYQGLESHETADERDPTFSSEAEQTAYGKPRGYANGLTFNRMEGTSVAQSIPEQSITFTPTPAFPRPRARFNVLDSSDDRATPRPLKNQSEANEDLEEQVDDMEQTVYQSQHRQVCIADDDLVTPHSRRRSFLLSVVNSTARPRFKHPTPHPRNVMATPLFTGVSVAPTPATAFRTAFAGYTPRPRLPSGSSGNSGGGQTSSQSVSVITRSSPSVEPTYNSAKKPGVARVQWVAPGPTGSISPQQPTENASFISTASSHDLTTHYRVNTSFDPVMGFGAGAPGHGVGRFNAGKLNTYLHGLNRKLQEENEALMEKLRRLQEQEKDVVADDKNQESLSAAFSSGSRRSSAGRRVSGGAILDDVREDVVAEGWLEEKAQLEELVESYKEEVGQISEKKEESERNLETERKERECDKQRWKDRMVELEQGVEAVVKDLEQKLEQAERKARQAEDEKDRQAKNLRRELSEAQNERAVVLERAELAERTLESEKELGGEMKESSERLTKAMDVWSANVQVQELEEELVRADERIETLEKALRAEKDTTKGLVEELDKKAKTLAKEKEESRRVEAEARHAEEKAESMKGYVTELEEQMEIAANQIASLETDLTTARRERQTALAAEKDARQQTERLEMDTEKAQEIVQHMKDVLQDTEEKMVHDQDVIAELRTKIHSLERELEREREPSRDILGPGEADIQELEEELDGANREIARLNTILNQSPARKAVDKAKDIQIEALEREKEELLERNKALRMAMAEMNTPNKLANGSGISPIHRHVLSMSIRAPRTPGGPLRDLSWLNSVSDPSVSPLVAEINRLQSELDRANENIDDKLDKLQDAGLGFTGLTKKLEDARARIITLEDEVSRLSRREDRLIHRMERIRCHKCHVKVDMRPTPLADESSLEAFDNNSPIEPETPTRTSEVLRIEIRSVNSQLENLRKQWEDEKRQLVGEKAALQDAAERLDAQVKRAEEEARSVYESSKAGDKARVSTEGELERAKRVIADLEDKLRAERASLRMLTTEQDRLQREKTGVLSQLQRTESDMDDVRHQLYKVKQENHELEKEQRVNAIAEQKARILEGRVTENLETIERLRHERSLLASDHKQLQRRFTELTEQANQLRSKYSASSSSHEKRRNQLDMYRLEMEDLRRALSEQADELHRAEKERLRMAAEKEGVTQIVATLQADLCRVKKDAEAFGRDLKRLRAEKDDMEESHKHEITRLERSKKQAQAQIRLLTEQLESRKDTALRAQDDLRRHSCAADDNQLADLKLQHNKECKGLMVQMHYFKAKFTRENTLRADLCFQKEYLLILLGRCENRDKAILMSIARIGFPVSPPLPKKRSRKFRSVVIAVRFSLRARRASQIWREQSSPKEAVTAALEDVRQRRAARTVNLLAR